MCHHIVRRASNIFDPPRFTGVESLGFDPPQRSEKAERFFSAVGHELHSLCFVSSNAYYFL